MKKNYALKFFAVLTLIIASGNLFAGTYGGGTGTSDDPYQIATATHLQELYQTQADWGANFKLTADIDMSDETFHPIGYNDGTADIKFAGVFDGDNHVISNLTVTPHENQVTKYAGLIGLGQNCQVLNLGLINPNVVVPTNFSNVGAIGGQMQYASSAVRNCFVIGGIVSGRQRVGGIVGFMKHGAVENCFSSAQVNGYFDQKIGGIVGELAYDVAGINACVCYGELTKRSAPASIAGGVVGVLSNSAVLSQISNSYYVSTSNADATKAGTSLTPAELRVQNNYVNFDFTGEPLADPAVAPVWVMASNGFATLNSFSATSCQLTVTPSVDAASTGTGTFDPSAAQTVNLGESLILNFNTSDQVTAISVDGEEQTTEANPSSYTFDAVTKDHSLEVLFGTTTGIESANEQGIDVYFANGSLNIHGASDGLNTFSIYELSGNEVYSNQFEGPGYAEPLNLSKGIYIVQTQNRVVKIIVK